MFFKAKNDVISNEVIKSGKDTKALLKLLTTSWGSEKRIPHQTVLRTLQMNLLILLIKGTCPG